jgi:hypothetical protein
MITRTLKLAAAATAAALLLAGCESGPDVRGEFDRAADFGKYRTYNFVAQAGTDQSDFKTLTTQILQTSASREMERRGYVKAEASKADLLVNFKGKLEEKVDVESTPAPYYGPGWGYGGWRGYGGYYGGYGGSEVTTRRYNVGTLVLDIVDREKKQMVYQGVVSGVVTKEMMQNREAAMNAAVARTFEKYPFVAGQATPVQLADPNKK